MAGSAVATIVWSATARNIGSMIEGKTVQKQRERDGGLAAAPRHAARRFSFGREVGSSLIEEADGETLCGNVLANDFMAGKAPRRCCGAARGNPREKTCGEIRMQRRTGMLGADLTALTANSSWQPTRQKPQNNTGRPAAAGSCRRFTPAVPAGRSWSACAQPMKPTRSCSRASASVFGCAGSCSTVAVWPSHRSVSNTVRPSGNSSAS